MMRGLSVHTPVIQLHKPAATHGTGLLSNGERIATAL